MVLAWPSLLGPWPPGAAGPGPWSAGASGAGRLAGAHRLPPPTPKSPRLLTVTVPPFLSAVVVIFKFITESVVSDFFRG